MTSIRTPRKLIEVALPLDVINAESLRRKQKAPKGWPTSFHKWWAQRPIAAARGVIFAQLVNDPSWRWDLEHPGEIPPNHLKASWAASRKRLFEILGQLVLWDNSNNAEILQRASAEIWKSWNETCSINEEHPLAGQLFDRGQLPALQDPFAGSGTIPMEAQRLGMKVLASDLNPVAVLINKALLQIPCRFSGYAPVRPVGSQVDSAELHLSAAWPNSSGLAEDIRYYGRLLRDRAQQQIGWLYPTVEITNELTKIRSDLTPLAGRNLPVTAWIWARTVKSPNPAFRHVDVPLVSTYVLSSKGVGAYVEPVVNGDSYQFTVKVGAAPTTAVKGTKLGRGANFGCILSNVPISGDYIKAEGVAGRMGTRLMAIVAESDRGRVYLSPLAEHELLAQKAEPAWRPDLVISGSTQYLGVKPYGMETFSQLFTERQLVGLTTLSDSIERLRQVCTEDAIRAGVADDGIPLEQGGKGARAYGEAISIYLALIVDRMAFYGSTLCGWLTKDNAMGKSMPQQALAMSWDFAEGNPFAKSSSDCSTCTKAVADCVEQLRLGVEAQVELADARAERHTSPQIISTDPPYYDNVPYADLSDFFYVWLRRSLKTVVPELFATMAVPKASELVAFAYRHTDGKAGAEAFFLEGMTAAMSRLVRTAHPAFPVTIYYAFKQAETDTELGTVSTGWETFLESVLRAGFCITGTWPMRTEGESRMRAADSNALASSIVLVCRPRASTARTISRREFLRELNQVLPEALDEMTRGVGGSALQLRLSISRKP
jgi:putative DNA methylase